MDNLMSIHSDSEYYRSNTIANSYPILESPTKIQSSSDTLSPKGRFNRRINSQVDML
jgi:hypothetical protein